MHFPATVAFLVLVYVKAPGRVPTGAVRDRVRVARGPRDAHRLSAGPAPDAPRLRRHAGAWGPEIYSKPGVASVANQYAAMPSLHVGWSLIIAYGMFQLTTGARGAGSGWATPSVTSIAVVATANHYWLDGLVALGLVVPAIAIVTRRDRVPRPTGPDPRWHRPWGPDRRDLRPTRRRRRSPVDPEPGETGERGEAAVHPVDDPLGVGMVVEVVDHAPELLGGLVAVADADRRPAAVEDPREHHPCEPAGGQSPLGLEQVEAVVAGLLGSDAPEELGQHRVAAAGGEESVAVHREELVGGAPGHVGGGHEPADRPAERRERPLVGEARGAWERRPAAGGGTPRAAV